MHKPEADTLSTAGVTALRKRLSAPPTLDLSENVRAAANAGGSYIGRMIYALRGPGRLRPHEFFYYRLYDPALPESALDRFVGKVVQRRVHLACNDHAWFAACHDKLLWSTILAGAGLPTPETVAVFHLHGQVAGKTLTSEDDLKRFIADPGNHPLFCKPLAGAYSLGAIRIEGIESDRLIINGGEQRPLDDVVRFISTLGPAGYLLQRVLRPHPALAPLTGASIASIRFLVLLGRNGPTIESAVIKLPTKDQVADNFWREGNMLGAIDAGSGSIVRAIIGTGANQRVVDTHPASGAKLAGFAVPDFAAAAAMCSQAARHFRGVRTQSWDVALTADGPVLGELNSGGDLNLHQLAHHRGILSDAYCRHLKDCGYKGRLPA